MESCINKEDLLFNLEKGLEHEQEALETCETLVGLLENSEEKAIIEKIAEDEKRHIKIVEYLIELTREQYLN